MRAPIWLAVAALLLSVMCAPATAEVTYTFTHIPEPGDDDTARANGAIGEAQLFVDVVPYGTDQVLFTFRNTGPETCSLTDVYYDDGALLGIADLIDADDGTGGDEGVDFSQYADPEELPAGSQLWPPFVTTEGFSADSDPPATHNGVEPNESLGIIFDLQFGLGYADVLDSLTWGTLRIGLKVQSFATGNSESFVNGDVVPVDRTLTTSSTAGGSVTEPGEPGPYSYSHGQDVNIIATPETGYHFVNWTGDVNTIDNVTDPCTLITMLDDYAVQANFEIDQFTITATSGANGTIDPNGAIVKNYGDDQQFNADPDAGYQVDIWTVDGNTVQSGGGTYTLTNITSNHTVHVTFKPVQYSITVTSGTNGSVDPNGVVDVNHGENGTFCASPDTCWQRPGYKQYLLHADQYHRRPQPRGYIQTNQAYRHGHGRRKRHDRSQRCYRCQLRR
jgi:hypothetical protein